MRKVTPDGKPQWITVSRRNHFFDCEAMNEAAGHMLAAQKIPVGASRAVDGGFDADDDTDTPHPPKPPTVDPRALDGELRRAR